MHTVQLRRLNDLKEWREQARALLRSEVPPEAVVWQVSDETSLFADAESDAAATTPAAVTARVPREFLTLSETALCHHDPQRFGLLYRLLWRLTHGEPGLLARLTDDDVKRAVDWTKAVRRDNHKMKAFVRFREVMLESAPAEGGSVFVAWFEPAHYIVERTAPFFVRRFAGMRWSILTPYASAHWDGEALRFGAGAAKADAPGGDALEDLWRTYYASIFNPARLKLNAMKSEMPVKYWKNLPEAAVIPELVRNARPRMTEMIDAHATTPRKRVRPAPAAAEVPAGSLAELRVQVKECRNCPLWQPATQAVFGEGPADADIVFIGEQPGDKEDLAGKPFIGPAGKLFDEALADAGIDRKAVYVTNTVKHFKFEPRGKFRLHKRASAEEQKACRPWLAAELAQVKPKKIVCLGGMAASAIFGSKFKLMAERGQWRDLDEGTRAFATVHPSYLLRLPDVAARQAAYVDFLRDLRLLTG